jgi:dihydropteroate synthase
MAGIGQAPAPVLQCGRYALSLAHPIVMGVVNVTPDSFSDGGRYVERQAAIDHGRRLIAEGAQILDIGAESTRPGAQPVTAIEELQRLAPVLEGLLDAGVPISIDTSKPEVMRTVLAQGADMINDVCAFRAEGALQSVAPGSAALCVMHMQGEPRTMQRSPQYADVAGEVGSFLAERAAAAEAAGIARSRIVIDPGFGFGKTLAHNLELLRRLEEIVARGWPVMIGVSRKTMLGTITGQGVGERVHASVAAALLGALRGAKIVRVHDVQATCDALKVLAAVEAPAPG